jgi:N-acyl-D-aspartate/D-glutamate deacylase
MLDILVKGGEVVDGTGAPPRRADVGIRDGRVVAVGATDEPARRVIEAEGRVVAPGFIDVHTHLDAQAFWDPTLSPSPLHGVTTVIGGNCGFTIAPLKADQASYLMRMLARVEGMPLESLEAGVPWDWKTTAEFFDRLDGTLAVNAGFMVGHSAIRRVVMGEAGTERTATDEETASMVALLRDGLAAGGLGFSSTWANTHSDAEGRPVPSRHASAGELIALAEVCRDFPGTSLEFLPVAIGSFSDEIVDLMSTMSVRAARPLNWNVISVTAGTLPKWLDKLDAGTYARQRGGKVIGLTIPMDPPVFYSFRTGFVLDTLPGWDKVMPLPPQEKLRILRDPAERRRLNELAQQPNPSRETANWGQRIISQTFTPQTKRYQGRVVADIAAEEGKEPFDALLDIVCADELRTTFTKLVVADSDEDWAARLRVWRDPRAVVGASDAGAHLDFLGTFNYTTVLLQKAVRERQLLPIEEAVHLLTDVPAQLYGLRDRGRLAEGAHADVIVFDPATVGTEPLSTRFDLPAGAGRLYAAATGVDHVLVNGVEIATGGEFTEDRPGTLMRAGRDTFTPSLD